MTPLEQATLFSKHKKRQIMRERGVDVERIQEERSFLQMASKISDSPLDNLDANFFEENKAFQANHSAMSKKFENVSELDILDCMVAETIHDSETLHNISELGREVHKKRETLDSISYEMLLDQINEIKQNIPRIQNRTTKQNRETEHNQQEYQNWDNVNFERRFINGILGEVDESTQ